MELTLDINPEELTTYLHDQSWIAAKEAVIRIEKPGEGNMNRVLRAITSTGSIILKQATEFVVKYPDIPAPISRIDVEQQFYQLAAVIPAIQNRQPTIMGFDGDNHVLAMEDLGSASDFTFLYQSGKVLTDDQATLIGNSLQALHGHEFPDDTVNHFPKNYELRKLNHQHIFELPFMTENSFDLDGFTPGLQEVSLKHKSDEGLKTAASNLGEVYLGNGTNLLHGDYYPGSWLNTDKGFQLIDPEFSFFGPPEFDLGVLLAHLKLSEQPESIRAIILKSYTSEVDETLLQQFEGIEIMRRLIGLAQLPLSMDLDRKSKLLQYAHQQVMKA
ncbi:MAG: phosphotransferase [Cytophagales bacterium]|nr:phosphotransferase [Cytophagales bacterium]